MAAAAAPLRIAIAIAGFGDFERSTLAAYFRLAAGPAGAYLQVADAAQADFLVADAEQAGALSSPRVGDTVFVGAAAPPGALACLPRPIDPVLIVRELDRAAAARGHAKARRGDIDAGPRLALVVDDSATARRFLALGLERLGYRVQAVSSGQAALDAAARQTFALATVDVVLGPPGGIDGWQVCRVLKARPGAPVVVFVTGCAAESDRVRGSLAGGDAYLVKPLAEAVFLDAVQALQAAALPRR